MIPIPQAQIRAMLIAALEVAHEDLCRWMDASGWDEEDDETMKTINEALEIARDEGNVLAAHCPTCERPWHQHDLEPCR